MAKKILKRGDPDKISGLKYFRCDYCGCVFEADKNDYWSGDMRDPGYYSSCPDCGAGCSETRNPKSDVQSLMNAINKKETEIVPSHPVFWAKEWKCLSCNELISLPDMTDVCDYKYCPYCGGKNTIFGKTMEELHIREDDESESTTD